MLSQGKYSGKLFCTEVNMFCNAMDKQDRLRADLSRRKRNITPCITKAGCHGCSSAKWVRRGSELPNPTTGYNLTGDITITLSSEERNLICDALTTVGIKAVDLTPYINLADRIVKGE